MTNITGPKGRIIVQKAYGSLGWRVYEDGSVHTSYFGSFNDAIKHADWLANTARVYTSNAYAGGGPEVAPLSDMPGYIRIAGGRSHGRVDVHEKHLEALIQRLTLRCRDIQEREMNG